MAEASLELLQRMVQQTLDGQAMLRKDNQNMRRRLARIERVLLSLQRSDSVEPPQRRLLSVREVSQALNMSPATFWRRIDQFDCVKVGRRTFVTRESVEAFLDALPTLAEHLDHLEQPD